MNLIYKYINSSNFQSLILVPKVQKELLETLRNATDGFIGSKNDNFNRTILRDKLNNVFSDDINVECHYINEDRHSITVNYILKAELVEREIHLQL